MRENNEAVREGIRKRFSKAMSEEEFDELMDLSKRLTAILSKVIPEDTAAVKRNEARLKTEQIESRIIKLKRSRLRLRLIYS